MVGISDTSTSRGLKEKPPPRGGPAPLPRGPAPARERKATPARGSSTPVEIFFAHAWGASTLVEIFFAHTWGASTLVEIFFAHAHPKWLIFDHFHRAGAIFLSQRHPKRPPGATQGRSFFHAAPRDDTESPPVWRPPRGMGPGRGAGGRRQGQGGQHTDPRPIGGRREACGAWPGNKQTPRPIGGRRAAWGLATAPVGGGRARMGHSQAQASPNWRLPRGLRGLAAVPVGDGRARAGNTPSPDRLEAAARPAGPGRASSRRAERSSQRGRRAGGQATRRPEIRRANSNAGNQAISGSQAPSGSPTWRRHPPGQAGATNRRRRARGPRPRR